MTYRSVIVILAPLFCVVPALSQVGPVTWERQESDVKFPHGTHVTDLEIDCTVCHGGASSSTTSDDRLFPTMDVCADCHAVDNDEECGICHRDPDDPEASPHPKRPITFSHAAHLERGRACPDCHGVVAGGGSEAGAESSPLPTMAQCMDCHDGLRGDKGCRLCHGENVTLADIHPSDWRHTHGDFAAQGKMNCAGCHRNRRACLECHRGDNLTGWIHDLNYAYTHGLDARSKDAQCARCHVEQRFCTDCHERLNRIPLDHSQIAWLWEHGRAARSDVETCESCHNTGDPTCSRAGCHADFDGVKGTDRPIHPGEVGRFESEGPWHEDPGYFCFQCHVSTGTPGSGFCGYCHGDVD